MIGWRLQTSLLLLVMIAGGNVWAESAGQASQHVAVWVRGFGAGSDKPAAFVSHYLRKLIGADPRFHVLSINGGLEDSAYKRAQLDFNEANKLTKVGAELYYEAEFEKSLDCFSKALHLFESNVAYLTDFRKLAELLLRLGATHAIDVGQSNYRELANRHFVRAYVVYPEIQEDKALFSSGILNAKMKNMFENAVASLNSSSGEVLTLESNPSSAEVYIDGEFAGVTPLSFENLDTGKHFVRLERDGFRNWGKVIHINEGESEVRATARLIPIDDFDKLDKLAEQTMASMMELVPHGTKKLPIEQKIPNGLESLGFYLNADQIYWADVRLDSGRVLLSVTQIDLNGTGAQRWKRTGSTVFSYDPEPRKFEHEIELIFQRYFVPEVQQWTQEVVSTVHGGGLRLCLGFDCEELILGSGVGAGVLSLALGGVFWAEAHSANQLYRGESGFSQPSQISEQAQKLRTDGESAAIIGDILVGIGTALVVGTSIWAALYEPALSADEVLENTDGGWGLSIWGMGEGGLLTGKVSF